MSGSVRKGIPSGGTAGRVTPPTDAERIQGQIDRGEIIAGPDAARTIASRMEEEFGDVWRHDQ